MKIIHTPDPIPLREKEYPSVTEQLEALWEVVDTLSVTLPPQAAAVLQKIKEVRQKYPDNGTMRER